MIAQKSVHESLCIYRSIFFSPDNLLVALLNQDNTYYDFPHCTLSVSNLCIILFILSKIKDNINVKKEYLNLCILKLFWNILKQYTFFQNAVN